MLQELPLALGVLLVHPFGDGRRQPSIAEPVKDSSVDKYLPAKRLGESRGGRLGPALSATDQDPLPAAVTRQIGSHLGHLVQESLHPVALAGLPLFTHRRVGLPFRPAPDLPGTLVRRLDVLLLYASQRLQGPESPLKQPGVLGGNQDDASRPAFIEQLEQRVNERAVIQYPRPATGIALSSRRIQSLPNAAKAMRLRPGAVGLARLSICGQSRSRAAATSRA